MKDLNIRVNPETKEKLKEIKIKYHFSSLNAVIEALINNSNRLQVLLQ